MPDTRDHDSVLHRLLTNALERLVGLELWGVSTTHPHSPHFHFGRKVLMSRPLTNPGLQPILRTHSGEFDVWAFCPWSVTEPDGTSFHWTEDYDFGEGSIARRLARLIGHRVVEATLVAPFNALQLRFSEGTVVALCRTRRNGIRSTGSCSPELSFGIFEDGHVEAEPRGL